MALHECSGYVAYNSEISVSTTNLSSIPPETAVANVVEITTVLVAVAARKTRKTTAVIG